MRIEIATEPAHPDRPNEDFVAASPNAVVLLDGAGTPAGSDSGCSHGVAWYVSRLGVSLLAEATNRPDQPLTECLAEAITQTAELHRDTCDLTHPGTPSATVIATRVGERDVEYLVLADSTLVLEPASDREPVAITDDREAQVGAVLRQRMDAEATGTQAHAAALRTYVEAMRAHRNQPGGFWVAAADPAAAHEALTGTTPRADLAGFALLSDGASRLVDRFTLADWSQALTLIRDHGPAELIRQVRVAENSDADGKRWPRGKAHDDTAVATITL
ncbi:protein phosphatase 2C domain-containing protein [Kitasatospora sp. RB6PN24]|uniref:protein phosphatase 2C domain-containing protein n=1 Tax=Kitasatospora humi TaxID=2893891 RepID=UPI001E56CB22|nr:protein phosphatase 2C domain-containing protein [Kitasatospora humi]MCC9311872.1 protein phosphatase 2C domain-containing protein [Kitasatospora humi]